VSFSRQQQQQQLRRRWKERNARNAAKGEGKEKQIQSGFGAKIGRKTVGADGLESCLPGRVQKWGLARGCRDERVKKAASPAAAAASSRPLWNAKNGTKNPENAGSSQKEREREREESVTRRETKT
jgi:hypothetical protein